MYNFSVDYAVHSAVMGCAADRDTALTEVRKAIEYYRALGYPIRAAEVSRVCTKCQGSGAHRTKRTPNWMPGKACPMCAGQGSTDVEALPLG